MLIVNIVVVLPLVLIIFFHLRNLNDKSETIYKIVEIRMDSLLLKFTHYPIRIDSLNVDNNILVDSKIKEFIDKVNKNNQSQFNELINEVNKNSLQFNKILASADSRLSREMNNLNTWLTLWIGLFAVLTIFVPICTYLISTKDLNEKIKDLQVKTEDIQPKIKVIQTNMDNSQENITELQSKISKRNEDLKTMKEIIDGNNYQLHIYTILSILKELSGQPYTFFDNEGRVEIIKDLLSGVTSKIECIIQNENDLSDMETIQSDYTFKFLFIDIRITMRQIQTYFDKREIIDCIQKIIILSDNIIDMINQPTQVDFRKNLNLLHSTFDRFTGLLDSNRQNSTSTI